MANMIPVSVVSAILWIQLITPNSEKINNHLNRKRKCNQCKHYEIASNCHVINNTFLVVKHKSTINEWNDHRLFNSLTPNLIKTHSRTIETDTVVVENSDKYFQAEQRMNQDTSYFNESLFDENGNPSNLMPVEDFYKHAHQAITRDQEEALIYKAIEMCECLNIHYREIVCNGRKQKIFPWMLLRMATEPVVNDGILRW